MKCSRYDELCDCPACTIDRADARIERVRCLWRPGQVTRMNSGGVLWAPVDRNGGESGHVPSHDQATIQTQCDQLNAREVHVAHRLAERARI
jgi:hypothetical protein